MEYWNSILVSITYQVLCNLKSYFIYIKLCRSDRLENLYKKKYNLLLEMGKLTKAVEIMKELTTRLESPFSIKEAWNTVVGVLSPLKDLDSNQNDLVKKNVIYV